MAVSGSADYIATRNEIISAAYRKIGVGSRAETLSASLIQDGAEALEMLTKAWQAQGIHLWAYGDATLFLVAGQASFSLGAGHATESYTETALAAAAAISATSITVDSATGISDGDNVGIVLDDDTIHWTTVDGAPAGAVITLTAGLASAAAEDNTVYAYTTKIERPMRLHSVRVAISGQETPLSRMARDTYFDMPNKTTEGVPTQFYYDPQLSAGKIYLWPTPTTVDYLIKISYERPLQDFDAAGNNPYFPVEWTRALVWSLAAELAPEHGVSLQRQTFVEQKAAMTLSDVVGFDREEAPTQFFPVLNY